MKCYSTRLFEYNFFQSKKRGNIAISVTHCHYSQGRI
jgi:hypothetical protein